MKLSLSFTSFKYDFCPCSETLKRRQTENEGSVSEKEKDEDFEGREESPAGGKSALPKTEEEAVVILQSHYRGYRVRKEIKEQHQKIAEEELSAVEFLEAQLQPAQNDTLEEDSNEETQDEAAAAAESECSEYSEMGTVQQQQGTSPEREGASARQNHEAEQGEEEASSEGLSSKSSVEVTDESSSQLEQDHQDAFGVGGQNQESAVVQPRTARPVERNHLRHEVVLRTGCKGMIRKESLRGSRKQAEAERRGPEDKEKAAVVIQSSYRGYRRRGQLRKEGKLPYKSQERTIKEPAEAAHLQPSDPQQTKDREGSSREAEDSKTLKADSEKEACDLAAFSRQVRRM